MPDVSGPADRRHIGTDISIQLKAGQLCALRRSAYFSAVAGLIWIG
jgi:hypothetical protein